MQDFDISRAQLITSGLIKAMLTLYSDLLQLTVKCLKKTMNFKVCQLLNGSTYLSCLYTVLSGIRRPANNLE